MSRGEQVPPQRIALIDERDEIAVMYRGQPQMDVGPRTDILERLSEGRRNSHGAPRYEPSDHRAG